MTAEKDPRRGVSVGAVVLGVLTDVGGTLVAMVVLGFALGLSISMEAVSAGTSPQDVGLFVEARVQEVVGGLYVQIFNALVGVGFAFLGGYIAGRVAKHREALHAGMCGGLSLLASVGCQLLSENGALLGQPSMPVFLLGLVATLPLAVVGGLLAQNRRLRL